MRRNRAVNPDRSRGIDRKSVDLRVLPRSSGADGTAEEAVVA